MGDSERLTSTPSPSHHKALERRVHDHVASLLEERRFILPTTFGPRPLPMMQRDVEHFDRALAVKEHLLAADKPDFDLQEKFPLGRGFDVRLSRQVFLAFNQTLGHLRFASLAPIQALAQDRQPEPMTAAEVREAVAALPPVPSKRGGSTPGPMTLILFSSAGFAEDARQTARSFVDGPPTILIEPNAAGGFDVIGPPGAEHICDLLDPEADIEQRMRARAAIEARRVDLLTGAMALDAVATQTRLPLRLVEEEARAWAAENPEGVRVKVIEGVPMLYRDASLATPAAAAGARSGFSLGTAMPRSSSVLDRLRTLFGGAGQTERKIAYLAERRAALSRQRDIVYSEMGALEEKEAELREAFKQDESVLARRRITSQIVQLQKDIERRRQTLGVVNQQINVVGTHLHNLEIARQGSTASLPSSEEIAQDAAHAEEVLAELQASSELADELGATMGTLGMTSEESAVFEQLMAEASEAKPATLEEPSEPTGERLLNAQRARGGAEAPASEPAPDRPAPATPAPEPARTRPETAEPEAS